MFIQPLVFCMLLQLQGGTPQKNVEITRLPDVKTEMDIQRFGIILEFTETGVRLPHGASVEYLKFGEFLTLYLKSGRSLPTLIIRSEGKVLTKGEMHLVKQLQEMEGNHQLKVVYLPPSTSVVQKESLDYLVSKYLESGTVPDPPQKTDFNDLQLPKAGPSVLKQLDDKLP